MIHGRRIGPVTRAKRLHSKKTTGLLSRMGLLSSLLPSAGVEGRMILSPARCMNME